MLVLILAYLGGVLTILSPCILPVLPFVFARSDRPFMRNGFPMLLGMAITFAGVATLAALGGGWAVHANQYGRYVAMVVLAFLGLTLLSTHVAEWISRPFVALGNRLSQRSASDGDSIWSAVGLGVATGLLWAPCAGPILGLLLTGAALNGASVQTTLLLLTYAAGAATSLGLALLIGGKVFTLMKRSLGAGEWVRRVLGVLVLAGVAAIALGLDTGLLTRVSLASTGGIEQKLISAVRPAPAPQAELKAGDPLPVEGDMPSLAGATQWLNSPPLTTASLRGKVVLVDFWTYSCINCIRTLPYVRGWADKYKDHGLIVIGVHAPEFAFEKNPANVTKAVADLDVDYPVALDNDYAIWKGFHNQYWPAHYFIDAQGQIRHHHFGEGNYHESEDVIRQLLDRSGPEGSARRLRQCRSSRRGSRRLQDDTRSPETYVGFARARNFAGGRDGTRRRLGLQRARRAWHQPVVAGRALDRARREGASWTKPVAASSTVFVAVTCTWCWARAATAGRCASGSPSTAKPPGPDHGMDTDADGNGTVDSQRLYQLVRQANGSGERLFDISFLDPGVQAYAFTFG